MKTETLLKVQSWIDGELSAREAVEVEAMVRDDAQLRALAADLRRLQSFLRSGEQPRQVPCSPEFYWSGIERGIDALDQDGDRSRAKIHRLPWWLRVMAPLAAGVAVLLVLFMSLPDGSSAFLSGSYAEIDSPLSDVGSITFRSETEHMTIVWVDSR